MLRVFFRSGGFLMKKLFLIILAALLLMTTGITAVFAVNGGGKNFVDKNGDMICDNKPQCTQGANFADEILFVTDKRKTASARVLRMRTMTEFAIIRA